MIVVEVVGNRYVEHTMWVAVVALVDDVCSAGVGTAENVPLVEELGSTLYDIVHIDSAVDSVVHCKRISKIGVSMIGQSHYAHTRMTMCHCIVTMVELAYSLPLEEYKCHYFPSRDETLDVFPFLQTLVALVDRKL